MTGQPPQGPDEPIDDEFGWNEPDGTRPRLVAVPTPPPRPEPADQGEIAQADHVETAQADPDEVPWGNSAQELLDEALLQLDALTDQVHELDELIRADRADQAGTGAGKFLRFRYERHPAAEAAAAHAELTRWVSWLVATYQLTDAVPPCWGRHDALAEELAGFYVAWQNVWADEGPYDAAAVWHEQLHSAVAARWPRWLRGARCSDTCALDTDFADQSHQRWTGQAATAGGADYRLTRTRALAPPIPPPTKKPPAKAAKPGGLKATGPKSTGQKSTTASPPNGRKPT